MVATPLAPYAQPYDYAAWTGVTTRWGLAHVYMGFWGACLTRSFYFPMFLSVFWQALTYIISSERTNGGTVDPYWYLPLGGKTFSEAMVGDQIHVLIGVLLGLMLVRWHGYRNRSWKCNNLLTVFTTPAVWGGHLFLTFLFGVICLVTAAIADNLDTTNADAGYQLQLLHIAVGVLLPYACLRVSGVKNLRVGKSTTLSDLFEIDPKCDGNQAQSFEGIAGWLGGIRSMLLKWRFSYAFVAAVLWLCYLPEAAGWSDSFNRVESLACLFALLVVFLALTGPQPKVYFETNVLDSVGSLAAPNCNSRMKRAIVDNL